MFGLIVPPGFRLAATLLGLSLLLFVRAAVIGRGAFAVGCAAAVLFLAAAVVFVLRWRRLRGSSN